MNDQPIAPDRPTRANRFAPLLDWLLRQGLVAQPLPKLIPGFIEELIQAGFDLSRVYFAGTILHPDYDSFGCLWTRDAGIVFEDHLYGGDDSGFLASPLYRAIADQAEFTRYDLRNPAVVKTFSIFPDLRAEGFTDYGVLLVGFGIDGVEPLQAENGIVVSFATQAPDGFADDDLALLKDLRRPLGLVTRASIEMQIAENILSTYLGPDAGKRVLHGEIRRGMVQTIDAAILFADLRGFTAMADAVPRDRLVTMLNDCLECMAAPIEAHGGQVLKFLGDGMLATFALDGREPAAVCAAAIRAAREACHLTQALNDERAAAGEPTMGLDIALHLGEVLYGNVGSRRRLDFTVIGPAVNEASRIEALCGTLDCAILASQTFVTAAGIRQFRSVGRHTLRGVSQPQELFTLT